MERSGALGDCGWGGQQRNQRSTHSGTWRPAQCPAHNSHLWAVFPGIPRGQTALRGADSRAPRVGQRCGAHKVLTEDFTCQAHGECCPNINGLAIFQQEAHLLRQASIVQQVDSGVHCPDPAQSTLCNDRALGRDGSGAVAQINN